MADFLFLFRGGDAKTLQQSPEAWQQHMQKWMQWMGDLKEQGKLIGAQPLVATGKVISGNKKVVTGRPASLGIARGKVKIINVDYSDMKNLSENIFKAEFLIRFTKEGKGQI